MQEPKILYVEDDPKSRLIVKKILENAGCEVYEAADGNQGVKMAEELRPDVILMDIMLPVMGGLEATKKIRKISEIAHIPIIAITAKAMAGDREQILAAGCDEYIAKPINFSLLLRLLSRFLKKELSLKLPESAVKKKKKSESVPSKTILLVDDTPKNLIVLQKVLESEGYRTLTASNGRAALEILKEHHTDLIISDIVMPEMDGYTLCYEVMQNLKPRDIGFIFYSSHYSNQPEVDFGMKLGADKYMVRPLKIGKLIEIIDEVLAHKKDPVLPMAREEFQNLHTQLLTSKIIEIVPMKEPFERSSSSTRLEMGRSYLVEEKTPQKSYDLFRNQLSQRFAGFCLTRTHPKFIKQRYKLEKTPFIWLSATRSEGFTSSIDLTELSLSVKSFVSKTEKSVILLDGVEFLASKMGFHTVLEFLQSLNEFISSHDCILLLPVDPETLNVRELSLLEREFVVFS